MRQAELEVTLMIGTVNKFRHGLSNVVRGALFGTAGPAGGCQCELWIGAFDRCTSAFNLVCAADE